MTPSIRADNRFRFVCPVVGREERYIACGLRRHRHWRGESIDCGGCASAMRAGKCPAVYMLDMETPKNAPSKAIFFDTKGEKVYGIPKVVAERIEKVLILPSQCRPYHMSPELFERLTGQVKGETTGEAFKVEEEASLGPVRREVRRESKKATKKPGDLSDALDSAKVDMAAAITAAAT
jgi:hypothetical protein